VLASTICRETCLLCHLGEYLKGKSPYSLVATGSDKFRPKEMDDDANILDVRFHKSVIASKAAFTYEEAQVRKDDPLRTFSREFIIEPCS
jgi:hypothetical protein